MSKETTKDEAVEEKAKQKPPPEKDNRIPVGYPHQEFLQTQSINMTSGMAAAIANITHQLGEKEHELAKRTRDMNATGAVLDKERKERKAEQEKHKAELEAAREAAGKAEAALALSRAEVMALKSDL